MLKKQMLKKQWKQTAWFAIAVAVWSVVVANYLGAAILGVTGLLLLKLLAREPIPAPRTLFRAIERGDVDTVLLLLDAQADPNARESYGPSPLEAAVRRRSTAIVEVLLEHGARPNATATGQDSALALAAFKNQRPSATLLVKAGVDPTAANPGRLGGTPLSLAVGAGYTKLCRLFLQSATIDADALDSLRETAASIGTQDILDLLVAARTKLRADRRTEGRAAGHESAEQLGDADADARCADARAS